MLIPTKTVKYYPNNKPWFTAELKKAVEAKNRAFAAGNRVEGRAAQAAIKREVAQAKRRHKERVEDMFHTGNLRQAWQGLNVLTGKAPTKTTTQRREGEEAAFVTDLNSFYCRFDTHDFSAASERLRNELLQEIDEGRSQPVAITEQEVRKVLRRINPSKSPGPDLIKGRVVKECTEELTSVLCQLFNRSLQENTIPTLWKRSEIRPIPKTNRPVELNDYRPVALTSVLVKCLERLVLPRILTQVSSNMDPLQFAYRPNRSVEDAVITVLNTTYSQLEKAQAYVRILFVDFSSAFNCMQPHILCTKLKDLQVDSYIILWIMDFLLNREQFVKVNNSASSILCTSTGAPQGTVISPVLFSLYTNSLRGSDSASMAVKFADDTALVDTSNSPAHFEEEATKLHQWCEEHYLHLNVKKTKELLISPQRRGDFDPIL